MDGITNSMDMDLGRFRQLVLDREAWHPVVRGLQRVGHNLATEQQQQHTHFGGNGRESKDSDKIVFTRKL